MSQEMKILAVLAYCLFLCYVYLIGHIILIKRSEKDATKNHSLEGEK
ncbi:hypothetical protein SEA_CATERPILLAR_49 [Arthrobacter phage Caterpillar]|nr:hypothetical protein SEA_CATERPILLAR_49 [Arthrobacter phage Caterpillar]